MYAILTRTTFCCRNMNRDDSKSSSVDDVSHPTTSSPPVMQADTLTTTNVASPILVVDSNDLLCGRYDNSSQVTNNSEGDEKSAETAEKQSTRKHNTRGRNGIKKQRVEVS